MSQGPVEVGRRRGRPAIKHSRERILDEAVAIATEEGPAAVTIRAVARRLGTSPMSLYRHVRSRGDLVGAVVDRLLDAEPEPPAPELWDERIRWAAMHLLDVFTRYPTVRSAFSSGPVPSQRLLLVLEVVLDGLIRAGCRPEDAADVDFLLTTCAVGFSGLEEEHRAAFATRGDRVAYLQDEMSRLPGDRYPRIFTISERLQEFVDRAQFARNVELVVEAARSRIAAPDSGIDDSTGAELLFTRLETELLDRLLARDLDSVWRLLADDFVITTAGWLPGPVDAATWLGELDAQHRLTGYEIRTIDVRRPGGGNTAVVLLHSTQRGIRNGQAWAMEFQYTDFWVRRPDAWQLAVRHASGRSPDT